MNQNKPKKRMSSGKSIAGALLVQIRRQIKGIFIFAAFAAASNIVSQYFQPKPKQSPEVAVTETPSKGQTSASSEESTTPDANRAPASVENSTSPTENRTDSPSRPNESYSNGEPMNPSPSEPSSNSSRALPTFANMPTTGRSAQYSGGNNATGDQNHAADSKGTTNQNSVAAENTIIGIAGTTNSPSASGSHGTSNPESSNPGGSISDTQTTHGLGFHSAFQISSGGGVCQGSGLEAQVSIGNVSSETILTGTGMTLEAESFVLFNQN